MKKELKSKSFMFKDDVLRFCNEEDIEIVSITSSTYTEFAPWARSKFILFYYEKNN